MIKKLLSFTVLVSLFFTINTNVYAMSDQNQMPSNYISYKIAAEKIENDSSTLPDDSIYSEECKGILSQELLDYINKLFNYIKVLIPIYLLLLGMLDLGKAVTAGNPEAVKKAYSYLIKRALAAIAIFFTPTVLNIVLKAAGLVEGTCGIGMK